ncbi:MAG: DUF3341 domain-containing protein [Bacteroidota bacterium]
MSRRFFIAVFDREHDLLEAVGAARSKQMTIHDVYTPYAVHGLDKAMDMKPSRLPIICLVLGLTGAGAKLWFQIWTSASSWPVNVGGKPLESVPAFIPVTFEMTVLFAGIGTVLAFLLRSKLRPGKKAKPVVPGITDDRFVIVLVEDSAAFDVAYADKLFRSHGAVWTGETLEESDGSDPVPVRFSQDGDAEFTWPAGLSTGERPIHAPSRVMHVEDNA